jgi:hypothetical protein
MSDTGSNAPTPGWYPAQHADNEQRYWTGTSWLDAPPQAPTGTQTAVMDAPAVAVPPAKRKGLRWWAWVLIALGILIVLVIIIGSLNRPATRDAGSSAPAPTTSVEEVEAQPVMVAVPDLVGTTANEAAAVLISLGLDPVLTTNGDADVTGTDPAAGTSVEEGTTVTIVAVEKPQLTIGQENAVSKASDYLAYTAFSRSGLIEQLEYEGFPTADAEFAVDFVAPDWNAQAATKAKSYLDYQSFSRQSLLEQLIYEGFTPEQAEFGVVAVGY